MRDGIIFVAGIYGVGKSTLCERLSISIGIPCFSAGDLISAINGEIYGRNKTVVNKEKNQDILVTAVNERLQKDKTFILAGHFCIFDKSFNVERLPESVFSLSFETTPRLPLPPAFKSTASGYNACGKSASPSVTNRMTMSRNSSRDFR